MDELEKIKIYAQMLLEVVNQAELKRYQEKKDAANAKEQQMLIDLSGISVSSKQRRDGRYQGYYTLDGTKHFIYGKSVNEVKTKIEFFLKHGAPKKKPAKKKADMKKAAPTVSEWLTQWIDLYKAPNLKPSTMKSLQGSLKIVFQRLGDKDLTQITTEELQALLLGIQGGRARDMCKGYLEQAFRKAFLRGLILKDPCEALEIKKHRQEHRNALTRQQQANLIDAIQGIKMQPLITFLLETGLRIGEALALTYADIDFEQKTVSVSKNVVFIEGKRIDQDTTKSAAGVRIVPIPSSAMQLLNERADKETVIFPFTYSAVRNCMRRLQETLGFSLSAHLLRHTYATRLEEAGISPKLKQYLMGHSTLEMTQNTYTDVQIEYVNANSDKIKAAFDFNLTTKKP